MIKLWVYTEETEKSGRSNLDYGHILWKNSEVNHSITEETN